MAERSTHRPKEPWDRRRDEPAKAYGAFEIYLNLPPGQRTLKAAYRLHTGNENAAGPSDNFKGWAKRHDWEERALACDDARARARFEGELRGIHDHWAEIAAQKERAHTQVIELTDLAYEKAKEIYAKELTKDNYSMGHAVQMSKFVLEIYKMLVDLEKLHAQRAENEWTEEDDRAIAEAIEALEAEEALDAGDAAARFFEEDLRSQEEEDPEEPEDPQV
jgi:hypothetical protein